MTRQRSRYLAWLCVVCTASGVLVWSDPIPAGPISPRHFTLALSPYLLASISFLWLCWLGPLNPELGAVSRVANTWSRFVFLLVSPLWCVFWLYFFAHFALRLV